MQFGGNKESSQFLGAHDMGLRARLLEGVAGGDGAILEAALKPLHALGGTSVGETLRIHTSAGHALQTVVTHCGRGLQAFIDVSGFQDITLLGGVSPDASEAVCLQFEADGELVGGLRILLLRSPYFAFDAQQLLHVMSNFVSQHIGLSEISRCAEALLQFIVEAQIDINLLVLGAVEWTGGGLGQTAGRIDGVSKQDQLGMAVLGALRGQDLAPGALGIVQDKSARTGPGAVLLDRGRDQAE